MLGMVRDLSFISMFAVFMFYASTVTLPFCYIFFFIQQYAIGKVLFLFRTV
jgi:hypothetical protein